MSNDLANNYDNEDVPPYGDMKIFGGSFKKLTPKKIAVGILWGLLIVIVLRIIVSIIKGMFSSDESENFATRFVGTAVKSMKPNPNRTRIRNRPVVIERQTNLLKGGPDKQNMETQYAAMNKIQLKLNS